ncbi:hypothetical protein K2173_013026 [Erythroxylum novogranatense]|uniref:DUF4283 domain-containing protein n=1 Tax=Erythroxylum novogranatense TaxID=1862640 RepID=A0AAV8S720_9ROSI|nr:hypothetical protein K2173_013026 [Erythroxylum novogranatense]
MKQTMAALWRPFMGVSIREADGGLYIFQFFHEVDLNRILEMSPVTFNNNLLILARMNGFTHPGDVPLFHFDIWVKVLGLLPGCMTGRAAKKIGNEISHFIATDPNNRTWSKYMRVRVRLDVRNPLKKEIQLRKKQGEWFRPTLEYEKLPSFCYICGYLDHTERFSRSWLLTPGEVPQRQFEPELRASGCRNNLSIGARWLRDPLNLEGSSPGGIHSSDTASNSDNGRDTEGGDHDGTANRNNGIRDPNLNGNSQNAEIQEDGVEIVDPKRKRIGPTYNSFSHELPGDADMTTRSKNGIAAGSQFRTRRQL